MTLLEHPPYSPHFAFSDFYLFPTLKKFQAGNCFGSNEEIIAAVNLILEDFPQLHFWDGIQYYRNVGQSSLN